MPPTKGAEERATSLLLEHLNPTQQRTFKREGYFEFRGSQGGIYRLYTSKGLVKRGYSHGMQQYRLVEIRESYSQPGYVADVLPCRNIYAIGSHATSPTTWNQGATSEKVLVPEADTLLAVKLCMEINEKVKSYGCDNNMHRDKLGIKPKRRKEKTPSAN